ncbi:hypothetical protein OG558_08350 [Kribbella sp. NBC_01510]|uniref:hypothetical protein n=1 Tax=Kribbella sp. NBC_01510 TaxID=2903581 RepID=UPI00386AFB9D
MDSGPATPCAPGTWQAPAQKAGAHTLTVSVTHPNGRTASVTKPWLVDQSGPAAVLRGPAQPFTLASTIPVSWTGSDTGSGVATKCPTCGSVRVYVNNVAVGTVSLYNAKLQYRAVIALPAFGYRSGTVVVKVTSSGKLVQIDGLGTSRA